VRTYGENNQGIIFLTTLNRLEKRAHILILIFLFIMASSIVKSILFQKILFQNVQVDRFKREKLKNSHNILGIEFLVCC